VRHVHKIDEHAADMTIRSLLPYDLRFIAQQTRRDPDSHVLEANMTGDLSGFSRWTIAPADRGARAVFEQDVVAENRCCADSRWWHGLRSGRTTWS